MAYFPLITQYHKMCLNVVNFMEGGYTLKEDFSPEIDFSSLQKRDPL